MGEGMSGIEIWRIPVPPHCAAARKARSRWVWPRARAAIAETLGCAPAALRIRRTADGKPVISNPGGWQMSLSHSGDFSLLALCRGSALGVDHERLRPVKDFNALARELFGEEASILLKRLSTVARNRAFFSGWVNLEALLKATGEGFAGSRGQFEEAAFRQCVAEEIRRGGQTWRIAGLSLGNDYAGAIAYPARLGRVEPRLRELKPGIAGNLERCG